MGRFKTIQYAIDLETGMVISRVDSEIAVPVLQYDKMTPQNNFKTEYALEKMNVFSLAHSWDYYKWTRYIPLPIKNAHRAFWGFQTLNRQPDRRELTAQYKGLIFTFTDAFGNHTFEVKKVGITKDDTSTLVCMNENKHKKLCGLKETIEYLKKTPKAIIEKSMYFDC